MKKNAKLILSAVLMISLLMSFTVFASADFTGSFKKGQEVSATNIFSTSDTIIEGYPSGTLPAGMTLGRDAHNIYIYGTPTTVGTSTFSIRVECANGSNTVNVNVTITDSGSDEYGGIPILGQPTVPTTTATPVNTTEPPKITKHPTGETVEAGGSATFIARADNATSFVWRIVSKDTTNTVPAKDAPGFFTGLQVSGTNTDTLVLSHIPASMDGWSVECKFVNNNGSSFTNGAVITIKNNKPVVTTPAPKSKDPVINSQPAGQNVDIGTDCTLSIKAISPDDGTLYYQWYRSNDGT